MGSMTSGLKKFSLKLMFIDGIPDSNLKDQLRVKEKVEQLDLEELVMMEQLDWRGQTPRTSRNSRTEYSTGTDNHSRIEVLMISWTSRFQELDLIKALPELMDPQAGQIVLQDPQELLDVQGIQGIQGIHRHSRINVDLKDLKDRRS
jgi:hypothetical protein